QFIYLPCEGNDPSNPKFTPFWQDKVTKLGGKFSFVDNSKSFENSTEERNLAENANYIMIPGGNTFNLLNNLRNSGLFDSIKKFFEKESIHYLGMSAGAIILAPDIDFA